MFITCIALVNICYTFVQDNYRIKLRKVRMKSPNVRAIRNELPHGAITEIAEKVGLSQKQVSEFFTKGWHQEYSNAILKEALDIIKGKFPDDELMEDAQELGLTGGTSRIPYRRKKKVEPEQGGNLLLWAAVAGAGLLLWKNWSKIEEMFGNGKPEMTLEERLEELKRQPKGTKQASTGG